MADDWSNPTWSQLYPPTAEVPQNTGITDFPSQGDAPPMPAMPNYLDLLAQEAAANPVTDVTKVVPGFNLAGPNPNVLL
jgi:hypothetical protein